MALDINTVVRDAAAAIGNGALGSDCLAGFIREHNLADHEVLALLVQAAEMVNRRRGSAAS